METGLFDYTRSSRERSPCLDAAARWPTGLNYGDQRYYNATFGRFTAADPYWNGAVTYDSPHALPVGSGAFGLAQAALSGFDRSGSVAAQVSALWGDPSAGAGSDEPDTSPILGVCRG